MPFLTTSRELSERVEKDAQKHPNRFRRRTWWAALWLSVLCLGWLAYAGARGEYRIFEGGNLSTSHQLIENDCAQCHDTWAPLKRLVKFDFSGGVHSVPNDACLACHPASQHHDTQHPAHAKISCAFCHIEHIGDHDLRRTPEVVCTTCHRKLEDHFVAKGDKTKPSFAPSVGSFSEPDGHPEFAFKRLLASNESDASEDIGSQHKVRQVLEPDVTNGQTHWRDRSKIKFNHWRHLQVMESKDHQPTLMILQRWDVTKSPFQELGLDQITDMTQACQLCHQADDDGRYMRPINYEQHCQKCHRLYVDAEQEVPHESPQLVRGFLTDYFTLQLLKSPERFKLERPERAVPGRDERPRLTRAEAEAVGEQVAISEAELQGIVTQSQATAAQRERTTRGNCSKCHVVERSTDSSTSGSEAGWSIANPHIPARWQAHAIFSHQSHQMMNCTECHGLADRDDNAGREYLPQPSVFHSRATGDVLLPGVALCRKCHSQHPEQPSDGAASRHFGARDGCVECHVYHDHSEDAFVGQKNPLLGSREVKLDAILKTQSHEK